MPVDQNPPTKLVVLMFTDLAGSVDLKTRLGAHAYARIISTHDRLFKQILSITPGAQTIKDTGDGFLARFETPSDALLAALRFQYALHHEQWNPEPARVRIGLHIGQMAELDKEEATGLPKLVGLAVDIAARMMDLAVPGQILMTRTIFDDARQYIREHPQVNGVTPAIRWMAHGPYLFKGSSEPLDVFEVGAEGIAPLMEPPDSEKARRMLAGKKKEMTILFSDLSGFTSLAERLPPESLVELLNEYLGEMTDAMLAHEGTLGGYMGDAIISFWGAPLAREDDAVRACRTALDQIRKLRALWRGWASRGLPPLEMRIGIHTGPVVVGNVGSEARRNYTVIGGTANFALRLEGANKQYGTRILIGEPTRRAAAQAIETREIDLIPPVGPGGPVRVFELLGLRGDTPPQKLAACGAFETALAAYRAQRWDEAEAGFRAVIAALGEDPPSAVFLQRIASLRAAPPAADWNGVWAQK